MKLNDILKESPTVEFNKNDWSGDETKINFKRVGEKVVWKQSDYTFTMVRIPFDDDEGYYYKVYGDGWDANDSLVTVYEMGKNDYHAEAMGISRTASTPYEAASQVLFNTI